MDVERHARDLLDKVKDSDQNGIEKAIKAGQLTKPVIMYEVFIPSLLDNTLKENQLAMKLLQCEINSLSAFHLAAMLGMFDLLPVFLDANVSVNELLESGTTALHLAAFGGHQGTVELLCDVYEAEVNAQDRYGWTALHYASTEGHLNIVKFLIDHGSDINKRDKDGTCAALRAQWQGHEEIVAYFCQFGEEDDLLNIEEVPESPTLKESPYSVVNKPKPAAPQQHAAAPSKKAPPPRSASFSVESNNNHSKVPMRQASSQSVDHQKRRHSDYPMGAQGAASRSATLPSRFKDARNSRIRRVIRKELEAAFSDYQNPADVIGAAPGVNQTSEEDEVIMAGVGMQTMTRLMREEIQKYKDNIIVPAVPPKPPQPQFTAGIEEEDEPEYESLYDTLKGFGEAPAPPSLVSKDHGGGAQAAEYAQAPPLPPRNPNEDASLEDLINSVSIKGQPTSMALNAAIRKLAQILGPDWKKLARALPIHRSPSRCEDRIRKIEKEHLGNTERQAVQALLDWRLNMGSGAEVDALILGMRKCGLHDKIEEMEAVTSEFTA